MLRLQKATAVPQRMQNDYGRRIGPDRGPIKTPRYPAPPECCSRGVTLREKGFLGASVKQAEKRKPCKTIEEVQALTDAERNRVNMAYMTNGDLQELIRQQPTLSAELLKASMTGESDYRGFGEKADALRRALGQKPKMVKSKGGVFSMDGVGKPASSARKRTGLMNKFRKQAGSTGRLLAMVDGPRARELERLRKERAARETKAHLEKLWGPDF